MGNACTCFEGPCAISRIPIPSSMDSVKLDTLRVSPAEVVDVPTCQNDATKERVNLDESICDTSANSQIVASPMSTISATRTDYSASSPLFRFQNLYWLLDNQRILSRLSETPPPECVTGDSEDSHW